MKVVGLGCCASVSRMHTRNEGPWFRWAYTSRNPVRTPSLTSSTDVAPSHAQVFSCINLTRKLPAYLPPIGDTMATPPDLSETSLPTPRRQAEWSSWFVDPNPIVAGVLAFFAILGVAGALICHYRARRERRWKKSPLPLRAPVAPANMFPPPPVAPANWLPPEPRGGLRRRSVADLLAARARHASIPDT